MVCRIAVPTLRVSPNGAERATTGRNGLEQGGNGLERARTGRGTTPARPGDLCEDRPVSTSQRDRGPASASSVAVTVVTVVSVAAPAGAAS